MYILCCDMIELWFYTPFFYRREIKEDNREMDWQHKKWNGNKEHTHTRSNDYCVGQRQMETSSSSLTVIV